MNKNHSEHMSKYTGNISLPKMISIQKFNNATDFHSILMEQNLNIPAHIISLRSQDPKVHLM